MPTSASKKRARLPLPEAVYTTDFGVCLQGDSEKVIGDSLLPGLKGRVDLIFTSPRSR